MEMVGSQESHQGILENEEFQEYVNLSRDEENHPESEPKYIEEGNTEEHRRTQKTTASIFSSNNGKTVCLKTGCPIGSSENFSHGASEDLKT